VTSIKERERYSSICRAIQFGAFDAVGAHLLAGVRQDPRGMQEVVDDDGPHGVEFEVALAAGKGDGAVLGQDPGCTP
jgi:hypothetical protein